MRRRPYPKEEIAYKKRIRSGGPLLAMSTLISRTRSYPRQQIQQAVLDGYRLSSQDALLPAANGRTYPQRFLLRGPNAANWRIPNDRVNVNRLVEFPIIRNDAGQFVPFTNGSDQGPDRVVFDGATGYFAGIFTHRGEPGNGFHQCLGHNQDVNEPVIDNDFGPTILDADPFGWFSGGSSGSGGFPMKRGQIYPAASFDLSTKGCPSSDGQCYCYNTVTDQGWFPRDAGVQAIDQACADWSGQAVPTSPSSTDVQTLSSTKQVSTGDSNWVIEMDVWQTLVVGSSASTVDKQNCIDALTSAMDNCQTSTVMEKIGGEYIVHISGVGSQQYVIHPAGGNPAPSTSSPTPVHFNL
ncbi:guanyl-specific ribonuclease F1 [Teratosphaeria destructans]|uniref:Guanyl-specific ribonuclease F1 n=1 Tax=Teratosphaeria destructans TaxID=418781 RepID=A0A9W7STC5_9PEZI|nr:guanyl-specific ribonuclease F1 [Teratosphaeria destructans]